MNWVFSSMDIANWFEKNKFIAEDLDLSDLISLKKKQNRIVSCVIPTLNEEKTVGRVINVLGGLLQSGNGLVDEIVVVDSGSKDKTKTVAENAGAKFFYSKDILPRLGFAKGKGENLWKSLFVTSGDIICWIDADIKNISEKFVYGLLGPILKNPKIRFSKAFYQRPLDVGEGLKNLEGGRVTELLMRPLYNAYFPQLAGFIQPLSGEYAGTRGVLDKIPFFTGYGVEMGLLIDIEKKFGLDSMAQVDLETRIHRNRSLNDLSKMSFEILQAFSEKSNSLGVFVNPEKINQIYTTIESKLNADKIEYALIKKLFSIKQRPPMITVSEYREKILKKLDLGL